MPPHETTLGAARLAFADEREVDVFVDKLGQFERGELSADAWRAFRLVHGTYGQRQEGDLSMLRVKIPQGILSADQARVLAETTERWSRGFLHLTTRQNAQLHFMRLHDVEPAMRHLAAAGLTTREACGNSVRNITCAPSAGVSADEAFDPSPYSRALTRYLLRHPLSSTLPRKFKIAFAGGNGEHAFALVNDIGFWPLLHEGRRAFRITVAGGTATLCRNGGTMFAALPAGDIFAVTEAVLRVFHAHGDRVHRARNRMKYLVKALGWDAFEALVKAQLELVRKEGAPPLPFDPESPPEVESAPTSRTTAPSIEALKVIAMAARFDEPKPPSLHAGSLSFIEAEARWRRSNVRPQRQAGYSIATVTLPLGDVSGAHLRCLALLCESYGDGNLRTSTGQDISLRWVENDRLVELYAALSSIELGRADIDSLADVTSCPGAESCKLAVTRSRGVANLVSDHFATRLPLLDAAGPLDVRVSGCPNGCGLHHVAGIQGGLRKLDGRAAPQYFVYLGGDPRAEAATFGRLAAKIPARRVPQALERLTQLYVDERADGEEAATFFQRLPLPRVKALLADLETMRSEDATPEDFVDLGDTKAFVNETSEGECSA